MARREETTRLCALTRLDKPVGELIRFVLGPDGMLVPDTEAKAEGRGVWVTLSHAAVAEAVRKKVFARSLKTEVKLPEDLPALVELRLKQRLLAALGMARKAGQFVTGATKVKGALEAGEAVALITATDAAADGRAKMISALKALNYARRDQGFDDADVPHFELLTSTEMGLALGLENVIHAALKTGAAAQSAVDKARRLASYTAKPLDEHTDRSAASGVLLSVEPDERR